jgi:cobalt-zinc-cadmium efflux system outer membrane protein
LRQRVLAEVQRAHVRATQAHASLDRQRSEVLPALEEARAGALTAYELGEQPYLPVLIVLRSLVEAKLREAELLADARRAEAELERAVGARLGEGT